MVTLTDGTTHDRRNKILMAPHNNVIAPTTQQEKHVIKVATKQHKDKQLYKREDIKESDVIEGGRSARAGRGVNEKWTGAWEKDPPMTQIAGRRRRRPKFCFFVESSFSWLSDWLCLTLSMHMSEVQWVISPLSPTSPTSARLHGVASPGDSAPLDWTENLAVNNPMLYH